MDLGIKGKKALVCAASKGMGLAIAQYLAVEGAELFLCARGKEDLQKAADQISQASGQKVQTLPGDLSESGDRVKLIDTVKKNFGNPDILIHNTGGPKSSFALNTGLEDWQQGFDRLFMSVAHLNSAFVPGMQEKRWGRIITITSLSVLEPIADLAISNAMRSAVTAMLKTLSTELAPHNITVNCVAPGLIQTERMEQLVATRAEKNNISSNDFMKQYVSSVPAGRMGTADEFAAVVCFLASAQASYVTGSTICVDGGKRHSTY